MGQAARARREGARARRDVGRTCWFCFLESRSSYLVLSCWCFPYHPDSFALRADEWNPDAFFFFFLGKGWGWWGCGPSVPLKLGVSLPAFPLSFRFFDGSSPGLCFRRSHVHFATCIPVLLLLVCLCSLSLFDVINTGRFTCLPHSVVQFLAQPPHCT